MLYNYPPHGVRDYTAGLTKRPFRLLRRRSSLLTLRRVETPTAILCKDFLSRAGFSDIDSTIKFPPGLHNLTSGISHICGML